MSETVDPATEGAHDPVNRTPEHRATALIELVHESLVDARTATLLVDGMGRVGPGTTGGITLCERAGCPVLLCPATGKLADVAGDGCAAVLTIPTPTSAPITGTVIFLGRLHVTSTYGSGNERTAVLELAPASIVVESSTAVDGPAERVDVSRYSAHCRRRACRAEAGPPVPVDDLGRVAERIRVHTNEHHTAALIDAAARLVGAQPWTVAGGNLAALDRSGLLLDWVDEAGGHRIVLSFTRPADDPSTLSRAVRTALEGRD